MHFQLVKIWSQLWYSGIFQETLFLQQNAGCCKPCETKHVLCWNTYTVSYRNQTQDKGIPTYRVRHMFLEHTKTTSSKQAFNATYWGEISHLVMNLRMGTQVLCAYTLSWKGSAMYILDSCWLQNLVQQHKSKGSTFPVSVLNSGFNIFSSGLELITFWTQSGGATSLTLWSWGHRSVCGHNRTGHLTSKTLKFCACVYVFRGCRLLVPDTSWNGRCGSQDSPQSLEFQPTETVGEYWRCRNTCSLVFFSDVSSVGFRDYRFKFVCQQKYTGVFDSVCK